MDKPTPAWIGRELRAGLAALNEGRANDAARRCRKVLQAEPGNRQAHFLVGLTALETGDRRTALHAFGSVTQLDPGHAAAWAHLARLFILAGQANRADRALREAVRHESSEPVVQDLIGTVHSLLGDQRTARAWYAKAVAARPDAPSYRVNLANSLLFVGATGQAARQLERVIARNPDNAQAHWLLASARKARDRGHAEAMSKLLANGRLPPRSTAFLYYGLGKELEDLQDWERAFAAFSRGAAAYRRTLSYDEAAEVAAFEAARRVCTREWLAAAPGGCEDPAPIFVVGQPRTGTTLVERIVASHSAVHSAGELQQFSLSIRRLVETQLPGRFNATLVERAAELDPAALGEGYIRATRGMRGDRQRFVDKLPTNYFYLPFILKALPRAKIVHLVRDPRDACFAGFKQLFADAYYHSYDQLEAARHFVRYHCLMATWRKRFPGRFHDVVYEDLVADVEPHARALIGHLGLAWEDACLRFHALEDPVATASAVQVREPAHTRSVGRWRRYRTHLAPMIDVLRQAGVIGGTLPSPS